MRKILLLWFMLILLGIQLFFSDPSADHAHPPGQITIGAVQRSKMNAHDVDRTPQREAFMREMDREIQAYHARNQRAKFQAMGRVSQHLSAYQDNTPAFVEDIMGFRNQMRLLRHTLADGANKIRRRGHAANRADQMVEALFAEHFFDDASIQAELNKIFHSYAEQLQGSRNQLYARVKVHMKDYDMDADGLNNAMLNDLQKEITQVKINEMMGNHAQLQMLRTAVGLSDITWVGGKALGFAKGAMALKAASMGGATVKAGAAGAAGGSAVGPKGTIAGVAGGVIVGLMIDTWAGNKIQEKLIQQTNDFHDNFRKSLLHGNGAKTTGLFHMSEDLLLKMESVDLAVLQEARGFAVAGTTVQTGRTAKVGN